MAVIRHFLPLLVVLATTFPALAWNDAGHTAIGLLAWDQMSPETRERATRILDGLSTGNRDLTRGAPAGDEARWAFARAGLWPDLARDPKQPHWLSITQPIEAGALAPAPSLSGYTPRNIVEAIDHNLAKLQSPATSDADRAAALCWLVKLVGDIHQPLHAATLYSPKFPAGDDGGKRFVVNRPGRGETDLHTLWDDLVVQNASPKRAQRVAQRLADQASSQAVAEAVRVLSPAVWAQESYELAQTVAYAGGRLRGIDAVTRTQSQTAPALPGGYEAWARHVARERSAIAAHRLATLLDHALAGR